MTTKLKTRLKAALTIIQPLALNPRVWNALLGAATLFGIVAPVTATAIRDTILGPFLG
jgi:hypothetical protein